MPKKLGRPTNNPKITRLDVRLDEEATEILESYCKQKNISKGEGVRQGIKKLKDDIKKK